MANPCIITYNNKDYSYADFATMLHDGHLDELIEKKVINPGRFKTSTPSITEEAKERPIKINIADKNYSVKKVGGEIRIKNKETGKLTPLGSKGGKEVIEAYKNKIIHKLNTGERIEPKEGLSSQEYIQDIIINSQNPAQIAEEWSKQEEGSLSQKDQIIKDDLRDFPVDDYYRYGDRNTLSNAMKVNYIKPKGINIDLQAEEMSNTYGTTITPEDIIDFVKKYPGGTRAAKAINQDKIALSNKFKNLTGLDLDEEFATEIKQHFDRREKVKKPINKWFSKQEMADAIASGEDIEKYEFLFDDQKEFKNFVNYVKQEIKKGRLYGKSEGRTQEYNPEPESNTGTTEKGQEMGQGAGEETEISRITGTLKNKIRSLRSSESETDRKRLAKEIINSVDGYLLNREGIMVDNDGSFALPNSPTFFNLLDQNKSVYYLDPDASIANEYFAYQHIINEIPAENQAEARAIIDENEIPVFDDAFRLGMVDAAKKLGYDGILIQEIDGTDSTIHILNPDKLTLIEGQEYRPINTRSDVAVSIDANKNKAGMGITEMKDYTGIAMLGDVLGINVNDITKRFSGVKSIFQKWLTKNGFIPESVFNSWLGTEGKINAELTKMKYMAADFKKAVKTAYKLPFGKTLSPDISAEINSALAGNKESLSKLPEELQEKVSEMRAHVDYLSQRMIDEGVVTGELVVKLQENMGTYLFRSFQKHDNPEWVQEIDPKIVNRAIGYIQQQYPEYTQQEIDGIINELLFTPDAPMNLIKNGKLGSKDLSILKKRKDLAPEIRALYGEYADPLVNYSKSIMKMINLIEKHKFLDQVKVKGTNKFLFEKPTKTHYVKLASEGSATMAPLNGLYTTPEIAKAFEEFNAKETLPKWMELYMKAISTVKAGKTVLNLTTHARNVVGNLSFVLANGHYNIGKTSEALKTIKTDLMDANSKEFREKYQHYQELGIVGDSSSAGELKTMLDDAKLKPDPFDYVNQRMAKKAVKATTEFVGKLYQAEDDFYKIYAFENEKARYKEAYGSTKSEAEVEKEAAEIVRNTYPTYSQTSRLIKEMRKAPILGTFISFPAEVIRTTFNTVEQTAKEIKSDNPKIRSIGYQRLVGQMISAALIPGISALTKYAYGISDEEEEDVRKFVAPWSKNSIFLYTGPLDSGKVNMIDLSQTDPHGFWQKPIIALLDGTGDLRKDAIDAAIELLTPFVGLNMVTEALIDAKNNKKTTGQDITNTSLPIGDQALDYAEYLGNFLKPGTASSFDRIYKGYKLEGQPDEYGKKYDFKNETLAAFTGQRISSIDASQAFSFNIGDLKKTVMNSKNIYDKFKLKEQPWMSEEQKRDIQKDKKEALNKSVEALKKDVTELRKLYFGAQRLGVPAKDLKAIVKLHKFSPDIVKLIYTETPLDKMEFKVWNEKSRKNEPGNIDRYLQRYLER